jgi:hypothetical protein
MSEFPQLKTGAVAQYPALKSVSYSTHVMRFVDGSEQRCREYGAPIRRWIIRLDLLDEAEMAQMEAFFVSQQGELGDFSFTDPWDGAEYASCSLDNGDVALEYLRQGRGRTMLVVKENRC